MKKIKAVFWGVLFLVLLSGAPASAIDIYGYGSYWDKKDADGTWGMGLGLSLPLFTEHLRLDGRAYFFEESGLGRGNSNLKMTPFDLGLQVHILPSGAVDPYFLGGVSYIYVDSDWLDTNSEFGGYVGFGLDVELGTSLVKLFAEALYRYAEIDGILVDKIDVSGFTGNIGVKLHF